MGFTYNSLLGCCTPQVGLNIATCCQDVVKIFCGSWLGYGPDNIVTNISSIPWTFNSFFESTYGKNADWKLIISNFPLLVYIQILLRRKIISWLVDFVKTTSKFTYFLIISNYHICFLLRIRCRLLYNPLSSIKFYVATVKLAILGETRGHIAPRKKKH